MDNEWKRSPRNARCILIENKHAANVQITVEHGERVSLRGIVIEKERGVAEHSTLVRFYESKWGHGYENDVYQFFAMEVLVSKFTFLSCSRDASVSSKITEIAKKRNSR